MIQYWDVEDLGLLLIVCIAVLHSANYFVDLALTFERGREIVHAR